MKIYTYNDIKDKQKELTDKIHAEYKSLHISTLGGADNACIMLNISLDKKETWQNGIFQNSRYYQCSIDNKGVVENFSGSYRVKKIRKKTVKTLQEGFDYINEKIKRG